MLTKADATELDVAEFINTRVEPHIRVMNGALDEDENGSIILTGRIDPNTLRFLKVDNSYQRPLGSRSDIFGALKSGVVVPSIDVGVRGQDFSSDGDDYIIRSPAFIVDGWQRVGTALGILEHNPNYPIRIFATIHFGTDDKWERHRFTELNKNVKKVSPNLHLRNMRDQNNSVLTLFGLSNNTKEFPFYKKVSWSQNMQRGELISALTLTKIAVGLHAHCIEGSGATGHAHITAALDRIEAHVSLKHFRQNVMNFASVIDECWPLASIEYRQTAVQIKGTFLFQLVRMFSEHAVFWSNNDRAFYLPSENRRKLSQFPISDPQVMQLAGATGASRQILYQLLLNHMNSGRRTNRLVSRRARGAS